MSLNYFWHQNYPQKLKLSNAPPPPTQKPNNNTIMCQLDYYAHLHFLHFSILLQWNSLRERGLQTVLNYPFKQLKKHWNSFPFDAAGGIWSRFLTFSTFSLYPDSYITTLKTWFYQLYARNLKSIFIKWKYIFTVKMTRTKDKDFRGIFFMVPGFHLP